MELNEKHRPSGVTRRIHTRDANGKKQSFDYIQNLPKYNKSQQFNQASKFQRINARPVEDPNGEDIDTVLKDGTIERKGLHLPQGYYNVNNVGGTEHWGIDPKTFAKKYEADPTQNGVYKPKGGPMLASNLLKRNTSFQAPWGGRMDMKAGSRILQDPNNPKDTYGIGGNEFDSTYKFDESKQPKRTLIRLTESDLHNMVRECVNRVLKEGFYSKPTTTYDYDFNSDSIYGNELDVQPSLRGESEWNPTGEDIREGGWLGPEWSKHARAIGGHHKVGDIVRSVIEHGNIPAGSIVKVTYVDHMRGYDIEDINTGKKWGEFGWII